MVYKAAQFIAYADYIAIVERDKKSMTEAVIKLDKEAEKIGLKLNARKRKYTTCYSKTSDSRKYITTGKYKFEKIKKFKYLGLIVDGTNDRSAEISERVQAGNRAFFHYKKHAKVRYKYQKENIQS